MANSTTASDVAEFETTASAASRVRKGSVITAVYESNRGGRKEQTMTGEVCNVFVKDGQIALQFERSDGQVITLCGSKISNHRSHTPVFGYVKSVTVTRPNDGLTFDVSDSDDEPTEESTGTKVFVDERPAYPCNRCDGEAKHFDTRTVNSWVNEASAHDVHTYECTSCGARGTEQENGGVTGCIAQPVEDEPVENDDDDSDDELPPFIHREGCFGGVRPVEMPDDYIPEPDAQGNLRQTFICQKCDASFGVVFGRHGGVDFDDAKLHSVE